LQNLPSNPGRRIAQTEKGVRPLFENGFSEKGAVPLFHKRKRAPEQMLKEVQTSPDPLVATETVRPSTAEEVAAALKRASDERKSAVIRGSGTKMDWARPAQHVDVMLDMRQLNRVLAHEHGDLTATIEAGATLRDLNLALARHRQWLPLDPPFAEEATIGGILATNDSGPLRHRYGTPRDLVIGIQLATTDGVLAKAGGRVVKNVAGYDLSKLITGSFGSLAAIVSATFKLSPIPSASKTMIVSVQDGTQVGEAVRTVMASQLEPIAFELETRQSTQRPLSTHRASSSASADSASSAFNVLLRFASLEAVVDAQIAAASAALNGGARSIEVLEGDAEQAVWREHAQRVWNADGAVVRASWLPANVATVLAELERIMAGSAYEVIGRAGVGAGLIRIDADAATQANAIQQLRASASVGNVVLVRGSAALKAQVDVWGSHGDRQPLLASLKRAFDPNGVLNAGRGPL
jgi:glycolate oxidase FAD binding subunit